MDGLHAGRVVWVALERGVGREQAGRRPAVVVSSTDHLLIASDLVTVVPATATDRGWPNHIALRSPTDLDRPTFAITEQTRTVSRRRIVAVGGAIDADCLNELMTWVSDWLHLPDRREGPGRFARA
jgi:mRNA interferase MazF